MTSPNKFVGPFPFEIAEGFSEALLKDKTFQEMLTAYLTKSDYDGQELLFELQLRVEQLEEARRRVLEGKS